VNGQSLQFLGGGKRRRRKKDTTQKGSLDDDLEDPLKILSKSSACSLQPCARVGCIAPNELVVVRENSKKKKKKVASGKSRFARELRVVLVFEKDVALILEALPF
jgi:hypothetical protein